MEKPEKIPWDEAGTFELSLIGNKTKSQHAGHPAPHSKSKFSQARVLTSQRQRGQRYLEVCVIVQFWSQSLNLIAPLFQLWYLGGNSLLVQIIRIFGEHEIDFFLS